MRIRHRIGVTPDSRVSILLKQVGIQAPIGKLLVFDYYEDKSGWSTIENIMSQVECVDSVFTEYSNAELRRADWLCMVPTWHHGYPMPDNSGEFIKATYELSNYCTSCGVGAVQKCPFRMRKEPVWGRHSILQLNWIFDVFFIQPQLWDSVFRPLNVSFVPVMNTTGTRVLESVVQIEVTDSVTVPTRADSALSKCKSCGRTKYSPQLRQPLRIGCVPGQTHILYSAEWFGSATSAHRKVIISKSLFDRMQNYGVRGASWEPVVVDD